MRSPGVYVDRKCHGLPSHRLRFFPDGVVRSDWIEWGREEPRDVKANEGRYTRNGIRIRIVWPPRITSAIQRVMSLFRLQTGAVVAYQLTGFEGRTYLVRENGIRDFERWVADPQADRDRVPPGTYLPL